MPRKLRCLPLVNYLDSELLRRNLLLFATYEQHPRRGYWDSKRILPPKTGKQRRCRRNLPLSHQQSQAAFRLEKFCRDRKHILETLHRAQGNNVEDPVLEGLRTTGEDFDLGQPKVTNDLSQKGRLLLVRLDELYPQERKTQLHGYPRKSRDRKSTRLNSSHP